MDYFAAEAGDCGKFYHHDGRDRRGKRFLRSHEDVDMADVDIHHLF